MMREAFGHKAQPKEKKEQMVVNTGPVMRQKLSGSFTCNQKIEF